MSTQTSPFVSVITPVYNGADFLADCIESVLAQTYRHFEYIIVNNRSTDETLAIANKYAALDSRIRVHDNERFVPVIENHNIAFGLMAPAAKYCKVVSGDDFIFPECLEQMVALAEAHPSVGLVGSYQLSGTRIRWQGFPYPQPVIPGTELCRQMFLGRDPEFGFGSPTSLLYRADQVRRRPEFYPNPSPHSDTSACYECLKDADFGFVYQVLCFERVHAATQSSASANLNRYSSANLNDLIEYGPSFLSTDECTQLLKEQIADYDRFLAVNINRYWDKNFWGYHKNRRDELGHKISMVGLVKAGFTRAFRAAMNPERAMKKIAQRVTGKPASAAR